MRTQEISRQYSRIKDLMAKTEIISSDDLEIQSHWAKSLCVLSAGFLENALLEVYAEYCRRHADQHVARFTRKVLDKIMNPRAEKFIETAGRFQKEWRIDLMAFINDNGRKDAINSIMGNRHLIAHGKDSGITIVRLKEYLTKSVKVIEFIEDQCGV